MGQLLVVCKTVPAVVAFSAPLALIRPGRLAVTVPRLHVLHQVLHRVEAGPSANMAVETLAP